MLVFGSTHFDYFHTTKMKACPNDSEVFTYLDPWYRAMCSPLRFRYQHTAAAIVRQLCCQVTSHVLMRETVARAIADDSHGSGNHTLKGYKMTHFSVCLFVNMI